MTFVWEQIETEKKEISFFPMGKVNVTEIVKRAKVPGGWLVLVVTHNGSGLTFYPDPSHLWDGSSLV